MLIASPIARAHYFMSLIPAAPFVAAVALRAGHERAARWLAWSPVALVVTHYALMRIVGRVGFLGIGTTIWFVCGAVAISYALPRSRASATRRESRAKRELSAAAAP